VFSKILIVCQGLTALLYLFSTFLEIYKSCIFLPFKGFRVESSFQMIYHSLL